MWVLGLGFAASQSGAFASAPQQTQVLAKLPETLKPLQKSLLFDQTFDAAPVRPLLPEKVVAQYLERLEAKRTPAAEPKIAASKIPEPIVIPDDEPSDIPALIETAKRLEQPIVADIIGPAPAAAPVAAAPAPAPTPAPVPAPAPAAERPVQEVLKDAKENNAIVIATNDVPKLNKLESSRPGVYVLDESSFLENRYESVPGATVQWLHPQSNLSSKLNKKGIAFVPYPNAYSARYIVKAPGYLPAVGYAVKGMISPVLLYREARLGPVLKSLNQSAKPGHAIMLGKFLSRDLKPLEKMSFDQFLKDTQSAFYSLGLFGLFHTGATETGPRGDFLINDLNFSLQYLLAKQNSSSPDLNEWPAQLVDLKGLGPILTTTLVEPKGTALSTQLVDAFSMSRPETGIYASVGGQRGLIEPDSDGILDLEEVFERPNVDLIEIHAQGYMKTWLNVPAQGDALPDFVPLFTFDQLGEVLSSAKMTPSLDSSYVIGAVRAENIRRRFELKVFGSDGRMPKNAKIFYIGKDNVLSASSASMDPKEGRFMIQGLPEGEWHLVLVDKKTGQGRGIQIVRTQKGTISQVQF
jgi:hypothetical protein